MEYLVAAYTDTGIKKETNQYLCPPCRCYRDWRNCTRRGVRWYGWSEKR